jgi:hypothetical protein
MGNRVIRGKYLRFSIRPTYLRIYLLKEGRKFIRDNKEKYDNLIMMYELLADFMSEDWIVVHPEDVGDLRDDNWLVITNEHFTTENEDGSDGVLYVGTAYHFNDYAIRSYLEDMVRQGYVDWQKHVYMEKDELEKLWWLNAAKKSYVGLEPVE